MRTGLGDGIGVGIVLLAMFGLLVARGVFLLPGGYDGTGVLNTTFALLFAVFCYGFFVRLKQPASRLAAGAIAISLFGAICFVAPLAAAASAIGSGDYVDPWLHAIDQAIFPFYDWKAVALTLPEYPLLYGMLNLSYETIHIQPVLFLLFTAFYGETRDLGLFITAWGLGLLFCILPFHWLPALSPMPYYGISQTDLPDHMTGLPWDFLPVIEGLRDGSIQAINRDCLTGIVTIPSFHACAATLLAWAFWRYETLRWPFLALNGAMAIAAVPIGSHYIIDVIVGIAVGCLAAYSATVLVVRSARSEDAATGDRVFAQAKHEPILETGAA